MSTMIQVAPSDCPYLQSTTYNIRDEIQATLTRLQVVIDEEASLRRALHGLFVKRKEEAIEKVKEANLHLDLVNAEEVTFCGELSRAAAAAHEGLNGCVGSSSVRVAEDTTHGLSPIPICRPKEVKNSRWSPLTSGTKPATRVPASVVFGNSNTTPMLTRDLPDESPRYGCTIMDCQAPNSPIRSACGLPDYGHDDAELPRTSMRCASQFGDYPTTNIPPGSTYAVVEEPLSSFGRLRSPARSTSPFFDKPPRSPARSTRWLGDLEPTPRSPALSTRGLFDSAASPAKSVYAYDLPGSPARSAQGQLYEPPKSPVRSIYAYDPPRSPARSARGQLYEPPKSLARYSICSFTGSRSPATSTRRISYEPSWSPARPTQRLSDDSPRSPTRSIYSFARPMSPTRSDRKLFEGQRRSPVGSIHGFNPLGSPITSAPGIDAARTPPPYARMLGGAPMPVASSVIAGAINNERAIVEAEEEKLRLYLEEMKKKWLKEKRRRASLPDGH